MARRVFVTPEDVDIAQRLRDSYTVSGEYRAALSVLLLDQGGLSKETVATIFGVDPRTIYDDIQRIKDFESITRGQWGGARNNLLSFEQEELFLEKYLPLAENAEVTSMVPVFEEYQKLVGKLLPKSTFYRMLKRHTWRMIDPDTVHPKANKEAQEEFKKKSLKKKWRKALKKM